MGNWLTSAGLFIGVGLVTWPATLMISLPRQRLSGWTTHPFLLFRKTGNFRMPDTRRVWRWETPLFENCSSTAWIQSLIGTLFTDSHWLMLAQDREFWEALENAFVRLQAVRPRSEQIAIADELGGGTSRITWVFYPTLTYALSRGPHRYTRCYIVCSIGILRFS